MLNTNNHYRNTLGDGLKQVAGLPLAIFLELAMLSWLGEKAQCLSWPICIMNAKGVNAYKPP